MRQDESVSRSGTGRSRGARLGEGPDPAVARWIKRTLASDPPRAKSLIVTLWGDALAPHGGAVWLSGLIRLLAPFGVNERLTRTSVFRLARDGWLAAEAHGRRSRYNLTPGGARRFAQAYRRIYTPPDAHWDGRWELVLVAAEAIPTPTRQALRDELSWEGFGTFAQGVLGRPAHGESSVARIAAALGIDDRITVLEARDAADSAGASLASRVGSAWDLATVAADYRRYLALFGDVIGAFQGRDPDAIDAEQCFVVRTLLIHAFRRVLLRDPQLPAALLPADWPGVSAYALTRDFYRLTHRLAERHLAATLLRHGETLPPADAAFYRRFGGLAPVDEIEVG
jgi:phenylacetic acid degradation operon negative regulatory protein